MSIINTEFKNHNLQFDLGRYSWSTADLATLSLLSPSSNPELSKRMMLEALDYASKELLRPTIGCVIAEGELIVAKGYRQILPHPDEPNRKIINHAEQVALANLSVSFGDLTVYSTLEPCYQRGATAYADQNISCTDRLIAAGVKTVVIGCIDADDRTRGKGIRRLVEHGIRVERSDPSLDTALLSLLGDGNFAVS